MALLKPLSQQTSIHSVNQVQAVIPPHPNNDNMPKISGTSLCLSACNGKFSNSFTAPWILDTGPRDHMICATSFFIAIKVKVSYSVAFPNGA